MTSDPVTQRDCDDRHRTTTRMIGWLIAVLTIVSVLGIALVTWGVSAGHEAQTRAAQVAQELQVYRAERGGVTALIEEKLTTIVRQQDDLKKTIDKQSQLIESLLKRQPHDP